jgi:hypothetical protein
MAGTALPTRLQQEPPTSSSLTSLYLYQPDNMSQDLSAGDTQHGSQPQPQHGVFVPTLPFETFDADVLWSSPYLANSSSFPPAQNVSDRLPQNHSYPFQIPNANMSSPTMPIANVYCTATANSIHPRVEFKSPRDYHPPQPRRRALWPNYAPGCPLPLGQMHSRLPSTDVGRKAPRKSIASSPRNSLPQVLSIDNRSTQAQTSNDGHCKKRKDSIGPQRQEIVKNDTHKRRKVARPEEKSSPGRGRRCPLSASTRRPIIVDIEDGDEEDERNRHPSPGASYEISASKTPTANARSARNTRKNVPAAQRSPAPRPRYVYIVSKKLEGIKKALGEDDWNEYLILTERKLLGEITEDEFKAQSKRIFLVLDKQTGGRIEEIVVNMVAPVVRQHAEEREGKHGLNQV